MLSPLDSYVTGRLVSLSVPVREVMSRDPLVGRARRPAGRRRRPHQDVHYSAAIVVDEHGAPVGIVTRAELVNPTPRQVLLVDHAEQAQSVPGVERGAHRRDPRPPPHRLDRDPLPGGGDLRPGRQHRDPGGGALPLATAASRSAPPRRCCWRRALGHGHPELPDDHRARPPGGGLPRGAARAWTRASSAPRCSRPRPTSATSRPRTSSGATPRSTRSATARRLCVAQIETVGTRLLSRRPRAAGRDGGRPRAAGLRPVRAHDHRHRGEGHRAARGGGTRPPWSAPSASAADGGVLDLPGVMSRKKQVAPEAAGRLLGPAEPRPAHSRLTGMPSTLACDLVCGGRRGDGRRCERDERAGAAGGSAGCAHPRGRRRGEHHAAAVHGAAVRGLRDGVGGQRPRGARPPRPPCARTSCCWT